MPSFLVSFSGSWAASDMALDTGAAAVDGKDFIGRLATYLSALQNGSQSGTAVFSKGTADAVRASGTLTISSGSGSVGGTIVGTAVTVTWATSDTASATALAVAINANSTVNQYVTATSAAGVVTLTANVPGVAGNRFTLVASGTGVTASGALLTGGTGQTTQPSTFVLG